MPSPPDLTLPTHAPKPYITHHSTKDTDSLPVALYTLVPLSPSQLHSASLTCESAPEISDNFEAGEIIRPAPSPHFIGQPLRAVYESHLKLADKGAFDPFYFVVVVSGEWRERGVLFVTLWDDRKPPGVGMWFCQAEDVGSCVVGLQVANTDWGECRCHYEITGEEEEEDEEEGGDGEDEKEEVGEIIGVGEKNEEEKRREDEDSRDGD